MFSKRYLELEAIVSDNDEPVLTIVKINPIMIEMYAKCDVRYHEDGEKVERDGVRVWARSDIFTAICSMQEFEEMLNSHMS